MIDLRQAPWRRLTIPIDAPLPIRATAEPAHVVVRRRDPKPGSLTFRARGEAVDVAAVSLRVTAMGRAGRPWAPPGRPRRPAEPRLSTKSVLDMLARGPLTIAQLHEQVRDLVGLMGAIHTLRARGRVILVGVRVMRTEHGVVPADPARVLRILAKHGKTLAPTRRPKKARSPTKPRLPLPAKPRPIMAGPPEGAKPRPRPATPESVEPGAWSEIVARAKERIAKQRPNPIEISGVCRHV